MALMQRDRRDDIRDFMDDMVKRALNEISLDVRHLREVRRVKTDAPAHHLELTVEVAVVPNPDLEA
tara:strand:+ start:802 stop:999 length:198 start_codon:yes stop_codon:yes gene_type:complete